MPEISVVIPIYNGESYLEKTLDSIRNQTFSDLEIICVDDGSTDGTSELLARAQEQDDRIKLYSQQNMGPGAARNNGLKHASGKYVIMLDSDDIYDAELLQALHDSAEQNDSEVVICRSSDMDNDTGQVSNSWWTINENQIPTHEPFSADDMQDFVFTAFLGWPWDKLYKRSYIEKHALRFPKLSNSEDLYFVFLSIAYAKRISIVDKSLIKHRTNRSGSVSGSRASAPLDFYKSTCLLKQTLKEDPDLYNKVSWSFLNWALQYLVWNIETMSDESARQIQLDALARDAFPELEIGLHSPAFFSLDPTVYPRYLTLLHEAVPGSEPLTQRKKSGRFIRLIIRILSAIDRWGIIGGLKEAVRRVANSGEQRGEKPVTLIRGSDFCETARNITDMSSDRG